MTEETENQRKHKSISVTRDTYDKLVEIGDMTMSFNDLITDLMKKANVNSSAAAAKED